MALVMCQHCGRRHATGIWELVFRAKPDVVKVKLLCADCGMDTFPSRHTVLWISLRHSLGMSSHLEGPECTSTLVPQAEGVKVNGRFFITCTCKSCGYSTQYELIELAERIQNHTHINLRHPDYAKRIKVIEQAPQTIATPGTGDNHISPSTLVEELPVSDGWEGNRQ